VLEDLQLTSSPEDPMPAKTTSPGLRRARAGRGQGEPHLLDYARVVVKRRHVALAAFAVVSLAAAVYSFTATPIYEGRAQLLIESDDPNVIDFKQVTGDGPNASSISRQDYYQTQYKLLQSRSVAKKTIDTLKLWDNVELSPDAHGTSFSVSRLAESTSGWVSVSSVPTFCPFNVTFQTVFTLRCRINSVLSRETAPD
jgi:uncharacterized protein involved in exopolysaccharide biosynthesis